MSNNNNTKKKMSKVVVQSSAFLAAAFLAATMPTAAAIFIERDKYSDSSAIDDRDLLAATSATTSSSKTYLVTFADDSIAPAKRCDALAKSNGGTVSHVYETVLNGCALTVPVTQSMQAQATFTALSNNDAVANVEFDQRVYALAPSSSSSSVSAAASTPSTSWGLDRIDQCSLPLNNLMTKQDATGVTVFIVDTGIRNDHVELASSMSSEDCHYSAIAGEPAFSDGNGHG